MKKQCDIVQDLLPLYVDGILKKQTDEHVKEHLVRCDQCRNVRDKFLKSKMWEEGKNIHSAVAVQQEGEIAEMQFIEEIRRWKQRVANVVITLLVVFSAAFWFIGKTSQENTLHSMINHSPADEQKISITVDPIQNKM